MEIAPFRKKDLCQIHQTDIITKEVLINVDNYKTRYTQLSRIML